MPVHLHVVTGILGSGKTTTLKHLVEAPDIAGPPAVVVGEFAEQGFDADMLRASGAQVVELSNIAEQPQEERYVEGVRKLLQRGGYGRIYLETSGVAHIAKLTHALVRDPTVADRTHLGPSITVLDAGAFRAHDAEFSDQLWAQVAVADFVVINKTDKVNEAELAAIRDRLRAQAPHVEIVFTYMGQLHRPDVIDAQPPGFRPALLEVDWTHGAPADFEAFVYRSEQICLDRLTFGHKLLNLPWGRIARFKGVLQSYDGSHCVNGLPGQLDWDNTPVSGETAIAFIGFDLERNRDRIVEHLEEELQSQQTEER